MNDYDEDNNEEKYDDGYNEEKHMGQIFMSPFPGGMNIPNPYKDFNLWTGYTNFPLTHNMLEKICQVYGVETLQVITPYRLRLGVGKLFKPRDIMVSINKVLDILVNPSGNKI